MYNIKKKSKTIPKAKEAEVGSLIGANKMKADTGSLVGANTMKWDGGNVGESAPNKAGELSAIAKLKAAKKKVVGEVSLGPTETSVLEEAQAPRNSKYLERLRKRAK